CSGLGSPPDDLALGEFQVGMRLAGSGVDHFGPDGDLEMVGQLHDGRGPGGDEGVLHVIVDVVPVPDPHDVVTGEEPSAGTLQAGVTGAEKIPGGSGHLLAVLIPGQVPLQRGVLRTKEGSTHWRFLRTAPQRTVGDVIPAELLARLREELEAARDARQTQLDEAPEQDDVSYAFREINEKALEEIDAALDRKSTRLNSSHVK